MAAMKRDAEGEGSRAMKLVGRKRAMAWDGKET